MNQLCNRQLSKVFSSCAPKEGIKYMHQPWSNQMVPDCVRNFRNRFIWPMYFTYFKAPADRYTYAVECRRFRELGLMHDDTLIDRFPVVELAVSLLPHDLRVARFRRSARAAQLNMMKMHMPLEMQNYDPFIPYMAPYIEEAKYIMQEENELMSYHPWDRRMFSGDVTGFGEKERGEAISTTYQW